jgi:uncharacterized protein (TIGR03437 family)
VRLRNNAGLPDGLERIAGAARLIPLLLVFAASALGESVPASISTISQPSPGHAVFDASGNTYYLSGQPTAGSAQTQPGGGNCIEEAGRLGVVPCSDAMVIKVGQSGTQIWGTLLGGPTADKATALAIDINGNVAFTGSTGGQFPTTSGAAIASSTSAVSFAAKVSSDGSKLLYSTYLPASVAVTSAVAVDAAGSAYIAGKTSSGHAVVLKLSPDGSTFNYSVTLGGSGADAVTAITVDPAGNAVIVGQTTSTDFPVTAGAFQKQLKGSQNGFLVRLDSAGDVLTCTYFGGSGSDSPSSVGLDGAGNIDLVGSTTSPDLPTTPGTMQPSTIVPPWNSFAPAGFVAQFSSDGTSLKWATYVMSSESLPAYPNFDVGVSTLAVGLAGDIYIGALTGPGFPVTPSAPVVCFQGPTNRTNGFLAHLNPNGVLIDATYLGSSVSGDIDTVGGVSPLPGGAVLVAWHSSGNARVSKVQFGAGGWTAPACLSTNVLNSATQVGSGRVSPGEIVTLTGFGIGPDSGIAYQPDAQGNVPTQLGGVQVLFDGVPVPILYAQATQINAIAPARLNVNGTTQVSVSYNDQKFGPTDTEVAVSNPGIFRLQIGQSAQAVAINQDGTINGPMNPAPRGSFVAVWGTGYGQTDLTCPVGGLNLPYAAPLGPGKSVLMISLNGAAPRSVQYAGSAPSLVCGVEQINFQVPMDVTPGSFSFMLSIQLGTGDNTASYYPSTSVTIAVK